MAQLAIKGSPTRGDEVIEILKMIGGINKNICYGVFEMRLYVINNSGNIENISVRHSSNYQVYTLEEFLEKFPYKVGDKVYYNNRLCDIIDMRWNSNLNIISYGISDGRITNLAIVKELKPYKEEIMEEKNNNICTKWDLPDGYEFQDKEGRVIKTDVIKLVKKQLQYPKTYIECCRVLNHPLEDDYVGGYKDYLLENLQKLIICRDTYWKIAGEQMGLNKPWEPDWLNAEQDKYVLYTHNDNICSNCYVLGHNILAFPTAEMRDTFFENFKNLIKDCKKLL